MSTIGIFYYYYYVSIMSINIIKITGLMSPVQRKASSEPGTAGRGRLQRTSSQLGLGLRV